MDKKIVLENEIDDEERKNLEKELDDYINGIYSQIVTQDKPFTIIVKTVGKILNSLIEIERTDFLVKENSKNLDSLLENPKSRFETAAISFGFFKLPINAAIDKEKKFISIFLSNRINDKKEFLEFEFFLFRLISNFNDVIENIKLINTYTNNELDEVIVKKMALKIKEDFNYLTNNLPSLAAKQIYLLDITKRFNYKKNDFKQKPIYLLLALNLENKISVVRFYNDLDNSMSKWEEIFQQLDHPKNVFKLETIILDHCGEHLEKAIVKTFKNVSIMDNNDQRIARILRLGSPEFKALLKNPLIQYLSNLANKMTEIVSNSFTFLLDQEFYNYTLKNHLSSWERKSYNHTNSKTKIILKNGGLMMIGWGSNNYDKKFKTSLFSNSLLSQFQLRYLILNALVKTRTLNQIKTSLINQYSKIYTNDEIEQYSELLFKIKKEFVKNIDYTKKYDALSVFRLFASQEAKYHVLNELFVGEKHHIYCVVGITKEYKVDVISIHGGNDLLTLNKWIKILTEIKNKGLNFNNSFVKSIHEENVYEAAKTVFPNLKLLDKELKEFNSSNNLSEKSDFDIQEEDFSKLKS